MKAILFDLDDTLTDRPASIRRYVQRLLADFGAGRAEAALARATQVVIDADGRGYAPRAAVFSALQRALPWPARPQLGALEAHWRDCFPASSVARAALRPTLDELQRHGFLLGVITNGEDARQRAKLEQLGIRASFSSVVVSDALGIRKPHPAIFTHALAELGCSAGQTWFIGDHPVNDVLGAEAAGLSAVWLRGVHSWPGDAPPPRYQIDTLPELIELVRPRTSGSA